MRPFEQKGMRPFEQKGMRPFEQKGMRPFEQKGMRPFDQNGISPSSIVSTPSGPGGESEVETDGRPPTPGY